MSAAHTLVLVRHGESEWNKENKFCGWYDADLTDTGVNEAKAAGQSLREKNFTFDKAYTSVLKRAIKTLFFIQDEMDLHWIPVHREWRLNERMYGDLQGLNKSETAAKHGEDQVKIWRRSYDVRPPGMDRDNPDWPGHDPRYKYVDKSLLPTTECLKDSVARILPFWKVVLVPEIKKNNQLLIVAHGNTVRSLVKIIDKVSDTDIVELNIPTGIPLVYELNKDMAPIRHYYTASDEEVQAAAAKIAAQGKAKQ